ncbi:hypothetical protein GGR58DRAFT_470035 [Xylaria digitata]|nr:hypothetical protein GGR58DRAFT_470035 [Xylaria digitata]
MMSGETVNPGQIWAGDAQRVHNNFRVLFQAVMEGEKRNRAAEPATMYQGERYRHCRLKFLDRMVLYIAEVVRIGAQLQVDGVATKATPDLLESIILQQRVLLQTKVLKPDTEEIWVEQRPTGQSIMILWLKTMLAAREGTLTVEDIRRIVEDAATDSVHGRGFEHCFVKKGKYYPGLPNCIMAMEKPIVISASRDRYGEAQLDGASLGRRTAYLQILQENCSDYGKEMIKDLNDFSIRLHGELRTPENHGTERGLRFTLNRQGRMLGTWNPCGKYIPSCQLDHCCFATERPPKNKQQPRGIFPPRSCAKWCGLAEKWRLIY